MLKLNSFFTLAIAILMSSAARADTETAVSCSTPSAPLASGTASCSALGSYGYATAAVASSVALPVSANQAAQIDVSSTTSAFLGTVRGISSESTAQSSADVAINFSTAGPLRVGYLELNFLQNSWTQPVNGSLNELLSIGTYTASPEGTNLSLYIPVQLGSPFGFSFLASIVNNAGAATGVTAAALGANISLQAFEADQSTPVELFDPPSASAVPEPGSLGMITVAALLASVLTYLTKFPTLLFGRNGR